MGNFCWKCYPNDIDEELDFSGSNICVIKSKESLEKIISESVKTNSIVLPEFISPEIIEILSLDPDHLIFFGTNIKEAPWPRFLLNGPDLNSNFLLPQKVVVCFNSSWCGPCIVASKFYIESSKKYPNFLFLAVDWDELDELASSYVVEATPTFLFLIGGTVIDTLVGAYRDQFDKKMEVLAKYYLSTD